MPTKTYNRGGYSVTIDHDGSILVKQGDSLSKYSMAIHGDFTHLGEYLRMENGTLKPIANVNLIYAGEKLVHQPSMPNNVTPPAPVPEQLPSDAELRRMLEEAGFPPSAMVSAGYLRAGINSGYLTAGFLNTFLMSGTIAFVGGIGGAITSIVMGCLALYEARNYDIKLTGKRATVYGTVGWAFGQNVPFPSAMEKSLSFNKSRSEINLYKKTWAQAVATVKSRLDSHCRSNQIPTREMKVGLQAWSLSYGWESKEPVPEWLAAGMLVDAAHANYSRSTDRFHFLQPWSWFPNDRYVGRPSYPPAIERRYPFGADVHTEMIPG